jgi:hypothetical protein
MKSTRTRVPGFSPPVTKVDAKPGNEILVWKNRAICILDIYVLSPLSRPGAGSLRFANMR